MGSQAIAHAARPHVEQRSEREWFEGLFVRYEQPLGRFLAQMTRSSHLADDLLQETFIAAYRQRNQLPPADEIQRWLFGIARNRALHALRGIRRGREATARLAQSLGVERRIMDTEALEIRDLLIETLAPDDRSLFILRYVHGFTSGDLATMTGLTRNVVRKRLSRAAARLAAVYDDATHSPQHVEGGR